MCAGSTRGERVQRVDDSELYALWMSAPCATGVNPHGHVVLELEEHQGVVRRNGRTYVQTGFEPVSVEFVLDFN